jgi:catalase
MAIAPLPPAPQAAVKPIDMAQSPALRTIGKGPETLKGRCIGILIHDGSDAALVAKLRKAAVSEGASVKIVAPKVGGAVLSDGSKQPADGQLAGTPSVVFDAVAVVLSQEAGQRLAKEAAAVDWVRDAFGHLKAIAADAGAGAVLQAGGVEKDPGVLDAKNVSAFMAAAKTRQWAREPKLRMLP